MSTEKNPESPESPEKILQEYQKFQDFIKASPEIQKFKERVIQGMNPTPRVLLYQEHGTSLYHYPSMGQGDIPFPILLIPSLVNRSSLLDLLKGYSLIEFLTAKGISVYLLDWGEPSPGQKKYTLKFYLENYIGRAHRRVLNHSQSKSMFLGGYCLGGNLALLFNSLIKGMNIRGLFTMATPFNFEDRGLLSWWTRPEHFNVDHLVDSLGNIPAEFFKACFPWLLPSAELSKARALYDNFQNLEKMDLFFAIDHWVRDNSPFPGEVYREIIKKGYQENLMARKRRWEFAEGDTIEFKNWRTPVLNQVAELDHIAPPESCKLLSKILPGHYVTTLSYPTGHLGLATGAGRGNPFDSTSWGDLKNWLKEHCGLQKRPEAQRPNPVRDSENRTRF